MEKNKRMQFYGGTLGACAPLLVFMCLMIVIAAMKKVSLVLFCMAGFAGLCVAFLLAKNKKEFEQAVVDGLKNDTLCVIIFAFLLAGILSQELRQSGLIQGLTWLVMKLGLSAGFLPLVAFLVCLLISTACGTSNGAIVAVLPVLLPVAATVGANPSVVVGAIVSGAIFGDNLAPISDTTIASALTQDAEVRDVVRTRLPYSLIAVSIATAIFPKISKAIADRNIDEARKDLSSALRNLNLIMCFFAAAFIVLPLPIILALLPSISVREALLISAPLAALGIGLPLSSSYLVIQRTFYAFEDGKHPFIFMAITMAIQGGVIIASTFILPPTQWITVIGLAISVSFILPYPLLTHMLRSRFDGDVDDKRIITAYAKALVATIAACVIGLLCRNGVYRLVGAHIGPDDGTMNWGQAVLSAILLTIVIAIVYLACLWALRAEELTSVVGMLAARIPGLGNKPKSGGTASPNGKLEQSTAENGDQE